DVDNRLADRQPGIARRAKVVEVTRHLVKLLRADDQIDVRQLLENRSTAVLRHAAEDPEDELRIVLLALRKIARLSQRLLLRRIPNTARIEQQDVAIVLVVDDPVPAGT